MCGSTLTEAASVAAVAAAAVVAVGSDVMPCCESALASAVVVIDGETALIKHVELRNAENGGMVKRLEVVGRVAILERPNPVGTAVGGVVVDVVIFSSRGKNGELGKDVSVEALVRFVKEATLGNAIVAIVV